MNTIVGNAAAKKIQSLIIELRTRLLSIEGQSNVSAIVDDIEIEAKKLEEEVNFLALPVRAAEIETLTHLIKCGCVRLENNKRDERNEIINNLQESFALISQNQQAPTKTKRSKSSKFEILRFGDLSIIGCELTPLRNYVTLYCRACYENDRFIGHVYYGVSKLSGDEKGYSEFDTLSIINAVEKYAPGMQKYSWRKVD
ncbi:TPA: hypothetical protein ACTL3O_001703 [Escherichia coli]